MRRTVFSRNLALSVAVIAAFCAHSARAQAPAVDPTFANMSADWRAPFTPHQVVGNVYYVGSSGLAAYLITTPAGHILINSNLESSVPQLQESVGKLGFKFADIKILLISHAHFDHCAGSAKIKELTGAKYMVMDADVPVVESGGKKDFQYGTVPDDLYPATKVDRVLHDGDEVKLGGTVLVAHKTAGHTRACTTWSMKAKDDAKIYDIVVVGSPNVNPGYKPTGAESYPGIAKDYEHAFAVWKELKCDVFLGAHGAYYGMAEKFARIKDGAANPFVDPAGYKSYIAERETAFRDELRQQQGK